MQQVLAVESVPIYLLPPTATSESSASTSAPSCLPPLHSSAHTRHLHRHNTPPHTPSTRPPHALRAPSWVHEHTYTHHHHMYNNDQPRSTTCTHTPCAHITRTQVIYRQRPLQPSSKKYNAAAVQGGGHPLPMADLKNWGRNILDGLQHLELNGLGVGYPLHISNIIITPAPSRACLTDFENSLLCIPLSGAPSGGSHGGRSHRNEYVFYPNTSEHLLFSYTVSHPEQRIYPRSPRSLRSPQGMISSASCWRRNTKTAPHTSCCCLATSSTRWCLGR